jgi:hypothetical protein
MSERNYTGVVPQNEEGKEITAEANSELSGNQEAHALYIIAKERLLNVNNWKNISGSISADFQLVGPEGKEVSRPIQKGDYFRIDIPGPGSKAGEGYDWVRVEEVKEVHEDEVESIGVTVRPSSNPQNNDPNVAHFFSEMSTSSFVVTREGRKVTANVYDRNIEPNQETNSISDKARNTVVGLSGKHGMAKLQWESLVKGLLKRE